MKWGPGAVALLGVALVVLFFMPWYGPPAFVGRPWYAGVSGWRFATDLHERSLFLVPACGLVMVAFGALRVTGVLAIAAAATMIVTTVGVYIAPKFPSDTGLLAAFGGAGVTIAGSFLERRAVRAVGGVIMAGRVPYCRGSSSAVPSCSIRAALRCTERSSRSESSPPALSPCSARSLRGELRATSHGAERCSRSRPCSRS